MFHRRLGVLICLLMLACDDGGSPPVAADAITADMADIGRGQPDAAPVDTGPDAALPDMAPITPDLGPDMASPDAAPDAGCVEGEADCACGFGDFCAIGLECVDGLCVAPCPAGADGCPCDGEACDDDLYCDPEADTCRPPVDCDEVECAERQLCDLDEDDRPGCLPECEDGFVWNDAAEACDPFVPPTCAELDCGAEDRVCVDGEVPSCGDCVEGRVDDAGECRPPVPCAELTCEDRNRTCADADGQDGACGGCLDGFVEMDGICAIPGCVALGCAGQSRACAMGDEACGACLDGFVEQNGACVVEPMGCAALSCGAQSRVCDADPEPACGACLGGFVEIDGACVARTCEADVQGSIAAECAAGNLRCVADGDGTRCEGCLDGLVVSPDDGACVAPIDCDDLPCDALGRSCAGAPFAACGGCAAGTSPADPDDASSPCVPALTCADIACGDGEFCLEGAAGGDAECSPSPCADGEAFRADRNVCVACAILCGEEGETGRAYPFTQAFSDDCICETESGYYADVSGAIRALPCDDDGDGWVRLSARASLESDDEAIRDNARCQLREVTQVALQNELGQRLVLRSCEDGFVGPDAPLCALTPVGLYETVRNDDAVELARSGDVPDHAADGIGRALRPAELNSLTKACVSTRADHNHNGLADVGEHHDVEAPDELDAALRPFLALSYFVELHRGFYEAPAADEAFGTYVIAERARCAESFAPGYAEGEGDYWRSCMRNRDAGFDDDPAAFTPVGYDFARFACDDAEGTCETPPPVTGAGAVGETVPHDLCTVPDPDDGIWRGMGHHSQFRCAVLTNEADLPAPRTLAPHLLTADQLYNGVQGTRTWQFNTCGVACPEDDPTCAVDCGDDGCETSSARPGGLANPSSPQFACTPTLQDDTDAAFAANTVGFVSSRYVDVEGTYVRGCINEWAPGRAATAWKDLCPGYADSPDAVVGDANSGDFGRLLCGCGFGYGGAECDLGCPALGLDTDGDRVLDTDIGGLHYGGDIDDPLCDAGYCPNDPESLDGGRRGYWMCGAFSVTSTHADDEHPGRLVGGGFELRGAVMPHGFGGESCAGEDCAAGWRVRPAHITDLDP